MPIHRVCVSIRLVRISFSSGIIIHLVSLPSHQLILRQFVHTEHFVDLMPSYQPGRILSTTCNLYRVHHKKTQNYLSKQKTTDLPHLAFAQTLCSLQQLFVDVAITTNSCDVCSTIAI